MRAKLGWAAVISALGVVLLLAVAEMPPYADPTSPTHNQVSRHYIERALPETGVLNMVTAIVVDYRAYDTLIETTVLFAAVVAVMIALRNGGIH